MKDNLFINTADKKSTFSLIAAPYLTSQTAITLTSDNSNYHICVGRKINDLPIPNPEAAPIFPPQIKTPEEQRFYKLCQTAKTGTDLRVFLQWMILQTHYNRQCKSHVIPISNEAKILMLRALMYNLNLRNLLYELGAQDTLEHKIMDSVINICIKDNNKLNSHMYRSPGKGSLLNPRVYQGDTIMHITGRLGFYNLINKLCTRPGGSELLAISNSCGFTPVAAIGDQMHRLSIQKKNLDPDVYTVYHDRLKGCKSTADSHAMIAHFKESNIHLLNQKQPLLKRIFNVLSSVARDGFISTALNEADYMCDRLLDNRINWLGFGPKTPHMDDTLPQSSFAVRRNGTLVLLYGRPQLEKIR